MTEALSPIAAAPTTAITTRFWWIRHAPVPDSGKIYGQKDLSCDCSDAAVFVALANSLPRGAQWIVTPLKRTHETAAAIFRASGEPVPDFTVMADFNEQNLGLWQGLDREQFMAAHMKSLVRPWFGDALKPAPEGESFADLAARTAQGIKKCLERYAGGDVVVVSHGGTIRAAVGHALGQTPENMLQFAIDNCSISRLDHIQSQQEQGWRVMAANHRPWGGFVETSFA